MKSKRMGEETDVSSRHHAVRLADMGTVSAGAERSAAAETASCADGVVVTARTPEGTGDWVRVTVRVAGDVDPFAQEGETVKRMTRSIRLLTALYPELGIQVGKSLSDEQIQALIEAGETSRAIVCGESSLAYGDRSARRLEQKLLAKGFSPDTSRRAVDYLKSCGWIKEQSAAMRQAEQDVKKRWGLSRIRNDLYAKGFERAAMEEALEVLADGDVDFVANCQAVIEKKYGGVPQESKARQSMRAALVRLGYSSEEIRKAMERCMHGL